MSHTLHRQARPGDIDDWVVLALSSRGVNREGSASRLRRFLELALRYRPHNFGDMRQGSRFTLEPARLAARINDASLVHAVFSDRQPVVDLLQDLRRAELGLSVVVSGHLDETRRVATEAHLCAHTVSLSLGVWGRRERLPSVEHLELTTMCGHGLIAPALMRKMARQVAAGTITAEAAAEKLAIPCVCGVFNPARARRLLLELASGPGEVSQEE